MNRSVLCRAAAVASLIALLISPASTAALVPVEVTGGISIEGVDTSGFPTVILTVGVAGGLVALQASGEEFQVIENGVSRPFEVVPVENVDDLNVVIVFDRSGSMSNDPLRAAKDAALAFIDALPAEVDIGLVSFSTDATVDVPITQDRAALKSAVEILDSDGRTSLYDAVILATSLFDPAVERKVLVVLSDGGDNDSVATLDEAVVSVQGLLVEMIELATKESNRAALDQLAAPRLVRSTADPAQLEALYRSVAQSLVGRVGLRYESLVPAGSGMSLSVLLGDDTGRSATTEFTAPVPPTTAPPTTLPRVEIVEPEPDVDGGSSVAQIVSFLLIFSGLMTSAYFVTNRRLKPTRERLIPKGQRARGQSRTIGVFDGIKNWIETNERNRELVSDIATLGLKRRPGSVVLSTFAVAAGAGFIFTLMANIILGLLVVLAVLLIARSRLKSKVMARKDDFIAQLPETLSTLSSMLRTGYGLIQALNAVADEATEPTKSWLNRVIVEVSTGRDLIEALRSLATELNSIDFDWVIAGIEISRETGGDLAKTMDTVAETIRERDKLRGQIKALTAEGRISAYVMLALPPAVGAFSFVVNPDYAGVFLEPVGIVMLSVTGCLMTLGYFWMKGMISKVKL